jgi:hypothetical protein
MLLLDGNSHWPPLFFQKCTNQDGVVNLVTLLNVPPQSSRATFRARPCADTVTLFVGTKVSARVDLRCTIVSIEALPLLSGLLYTLWVLGKTARVFP